MSSQPFLRFHRPCRIFSRRILLKSGLDRVVKAEQVIFSCARVDLDVGLAKGTGHCLGRMNGLRSIARTIWLVKIAMSIVSAGIRIEPAERS